MIRRQKLTLLSLTLALTLVLWGLVLITIQVVVEPYKQRESILYSFILAVGAFEQLFKRFRAVSNLSGLTLAQGAKTLAIQAAVLSLVIVAAWIGLAIPESASVFSATMTPLPAHGLLGGLVGLALYFLWLFTFPFKPEPLVRRGRVLTPFAVARQRAEGLAAPNELLLPWGGLSLPEHRAEGHFCIVGATGSGKTTAISQMMNAVLPSIGPGSRSRALIYDAKRDVLSTLRAIGVPDERIRILNPFDARSDSWDMAKDIKGPAATLQLASILIPKEEGPHRYFTDAARAILAGVIDALILTGNDKWTFRDVVCVMQDYHRLKELLSRVPATQSIVDEYFRRTETLHDIRSTIASNTAMLKPIAALWSGSRRAVSLNEWANGEFILVLGNDDSLRAPLDAINRVLFQRMSEILLASDQGPDVRTWVFLDELKEAGKLDGFARLLSKGRTYGVRIVLGFQDVAGLYGVYRENGANEILGLCMNKAILRLDSEPTAKWAAQTIGEAELREFTLHGESITEHISNRHAVLPSELLDMPQPDKHGYHGVFITPAVGVFRNHVPYGLPKTHSTPTLNFQERSLRDQYLQDWNDADLARFQMVETPKPPPLQVPTLFQPTQPPPENPMPRITRDTR